jgi:hypothetical protein
MMLSYFIAFAMTPARQSDPSSDSQFTSEAEDRSTFGSSWTRQTKCGFLPRTRIRARAGKGHARQTKEKTINSGSAESSVAAPPIIDTIAGEEEERDDEE